MSTECRLCGRKGYEPGALLKRVNEKGVPGIWECSPNCETKYTPDEALVIAVTEESRT